MTTGYRRRPRRPRRPRHAPRPPPGLTAPHGQHAGPPHATCRPAADDALPPRTCPCSGRLQPPPPLCLYPKTGPARPQNTHSHTPRALGARTNTQINGQPICERMKNAAGLAKGPKGDRQRGRGRKRWGASELRTVHANCASSTTRPYRRRTYSVQPAATRHAPPHPHPVQVHRQVPVPPSTLSGRK